MAMSPSSTVHRGQHDTKYVTFELIMHAAFVADDRGFLLEPARFVFVPFLFFLLYCLSHDLPPGEGTRQRPDGEPRRYLVLLYGRGIFLPPVGVFLYFLLASFSSFFGLLSWFLAVSVSLYIFYM